MHRAFSFLSLFLMVAGLAGCAKDIAGIDPPRDIFFYPTGLQLSPSGKTLFVTNGNSDLRYNGSTLMALDADRIHEMAAAPLSNACALDPGNPDQFVCGLDDTLIRTVVRLGSYAGSMVVLPAPEGSSMAYRLLVSVRAEPSLTWVDVYEDASGKVTCLDCGAGCDASWPRDCRSSHKLTKEDGLAADPFRILAFDDLRYAVVTHLNSPYLTVVDYAVEPPVVASVVDARLSPNANGYVGSYDAVRGPGADDSTFFVSNSYASEIAWYTWQYVPDLGRDIVVPVGSYYLQSPWGPYESGAEVRGLAFSPDGSRLHAAIRYPPVVATFDVVTDAQARTKLLPAGTTEVSSQPGLMQVHGADGKLFVTSFPEGEILELDPERSSWVQRIGVGLGPHEFVFFPESRGTGMYVVNFAEGTLALVAFSDGVWRRLGRFGTPKRIGKD